ncbi:MAG: LysR substrate-binding domain-containing protein [Rhodoferax sp.]|nr:LysR substrate-binding domain-containing protein [Rhodoferax sp.]
MNDRIHELDVFLRVTEAVSFSAAARSLDCNPSTVSKVIQRLEDRLGARLFDRTSRTMHLTQEGERFLEAARRVVEAIEDAEHVLGERGAELGGLLRINSTLAFAQFHLAPWVAEFVERHPKLRLEFMLTAAPVDLFEHQIDISLRSGYIPDSSLVARRIATSRWFICASPAYLARAGTPREPVDLERHQCLNFLPGSYRSSWPLQGGAGKAGLQLRGSVDSNSSELLRLLACQGLGIVRLSEFVVGHDLATGALVPVLADLQDGAEEPVFAVYASKRNISPRLKAFLDFLEEKLSPVPPAQPSA